MTKLTSENVIRRETATLYRCKPLVIELHAGFMVIGRKRERFTVAIDYAAVYEAAMKIAAREKST